MATLHLVMGPLEGPDLDPRTSDILRDFLQLDSQTSLNSASTSILALLPDGEPEGPSVCLLGDLCVQIAKQIPYSHPSQLKLARLIQQMASSPKVTTTNVADLAYYPFRKLGESLRENLTTPDPNNLSAWVNFHSFVTKAEWYVWPTLAKPTWAIWAMRDAFEQDEKYYPSPAVRGAYVLAAAQYVLYKGQDLILRIVYPGSVSALDEQHWAPGSRYSGRPRLDLSRWRLWRDGFATEAESGAASDEVKAVASKAAKLMNTLEETTPGLS